VGVACLIKTQMAMELPSASTTVLMIPTSQSQETVDVAFQKQTCLVTLTVMAITTLMTSDLAWPTLASKKLRRTPAPPMLMVTEALDSPMS